MKEEQFKIASVLVELGLSYDIIELVTSLSYDELCALLESNNK